MKKAELIAVIRKLIADRWALWSGLSDADRRALWSGLNYADRWAWWSGLGDADRWALWSGLSDADRWAWWSGLSDNKLKELPVSVLESIKEDLETKEFS